MALVSLGLLPGLARGDCWLIEGEKGYVWLAICSMNQPPYETFPQQINSTVHDLRLNENKIKAIFFSSLSRFTNLTDLNLTKNEISYIEDGAFTSQANLQVLQLGYNKLTNLTEGILRGLGRMNSLFLQHNLIEVIATNAFWECPSLSSLDLSSNRLAKINPSTFTSLNQLIVCELAGNPFHCDCELYRFLSWLEAFNNVTHTYDRLQCETPKELNTFPLLSPVPGHGRNAMAVLGYKCGEGGGIRTSLPPFPDGSGVGPDLDPFHEPTVESTSNPTYSISLKLQSVGPYSATLLVQLPSPFKKMYVLTKYNHTSPSDMRNLKLKREEVILRDLLPHTNYTYCVASIRNSQHYNHTCVEFATRVATPQDLRASRSTTTHYIMTILGCLFGMVIVLGLVYYCLRRHRMQEERDKAISVKKTILEMRYGPEAAASVGNDPAALQKLHEQTHHQHHHGGSGGGKMMPSSTSSSLGMLHSSANTSTSRLSTLPQVEKMATAFTEAIASKGNYMDIRTSAGGDVCDGGIVGPGAEIMRGENGLNGGEDSDDDGRGSTSEISTIAKEVDKVNQIINNCIDALKLDTVAVGVAAVTTADNAVPPSPVCITTLPQRLIPLSPAITESSLILASPKMIPPPPVPLVLPLSERPGISGGGFLSPPYRDPPPATAARPLQRQLSADGAVVAVVPPGGGKPRCSVSSSSGGSVKSARLYGLDVQESRSPDGSCKKGVSSPARCGGEGPLERLPLVVPPGGVQGGGGIGGGGVSDTNGGGGGGGGGSGGGGGCGGSVGGGGGTRQQTQLQQIQQHHLEVHPDYHCSEHRHSFPALYYEGGADSPTTVHKASFLKPLGGRGSGGGSAKGRDGSAAAYAQLSPRHHNYSGYSSSPEYSSESTLRIWERFRPYRKSPREEAYIAAGHALRKKVQFAKDEDLHDILDYWKGVSAQQKL
ncbi:extracellular leucine-rich repeat and fibronectin type III domain containing 2a [Engraulis encrasicolus]|uniref:extracellular leucine-rich repeat and fibronectin type III domain containing 2a n=1 Tax=Engraulis encrasicolus TaxID=184585 RepID=UPI002FD63DBA